jgi:hypothetical protein
VFDHLDQLERTNVRVRGEQNVGRRAGFDEFFPDERILEVDVPGLTSPVLVNFPWKRLPRPVFPIDPGAGWSGAA